MKAESLLGVAYQSRQVRPFIDRTAALKQDGLGGTFDQLLCAADSLCRVVTDGKLDAVEVFSDGGWFAESCKGACPQAVQAG